MGRKTVSIKCLRVRPRNAPFRLLLNNYLRWKGAYFYYKKWLYMWRTAYVWDTTLRIGEQVPGAKLNLDEK